MAVWEVDLYRRPLQNEAGKALWELLVCDGDGKIRHSAVCSQADVNADWLTAQLQQLITDGDGPSVVIRVFRPQSLSLLEAACQQLGIVVEPTRHTPILKQWLVERSRQYTTFPNYTGQPYDPLALDKPPPLPLAENLWGQQWRFASLPAADLVDAFADRPIPILVMPSERLPLNLGLASTVAIPGVVIDAGRKSMQLARWVQQVQPVSLNYLAGAPDGLVLEAGLVERWVVATFDDADVVTAARAYEQRKQASRGLHFLLIQPDDTGITYSGLWLLREE